MTDENNSKPNIRRVGRKDRKKRLDNVGPLFPPEPEPQPQAEDDDELLAGVDDIDMDELIHEVVEDVVHEQFKRPDEPIEKRNEPEDTAPTLDINRKPKDVDIDDIVGDVVSTMPPLPPKPPKQHTPSEERYPPLAPAQPSPQLEGQPPAQQPTSQRREGDWRHNVIALMFTIGTIGLIAYFGFLWQNPYSTFNPLPPPTPFVVVTATPQGFVGEGVVINPDTIEAQEEEPAESVDPTAEPTLVEQTTSAPPTPANTNYPFTLQSLLYVPNTNGNECNWASIAGTVVGLQGEPLNGYGVEITDAQNPDGLQTKVYSGAALTIGEGGFELVLSGSPQEGQYTVQLFTTAGVPVSDIFDIEARDNCDENVTIVNFVQIDEL